MAPVGACANADDMRNASPPPATSRPPIIEAHGLTRRSRRRRRPALADLTLVVPAGRIVGLVGPNGAGKTTLLHLVSGLSQPTAGTLHVLGQPPAHDAAHLARVGFVAQATPLYRSLTVAEHLRMGAELNRSWDDELARARCEDVGLDLAQRAGELSGGQQAQLALTLATGKRPELLLLDEPAAALDPMARSRFLRDIRSFVADLGASAIFSSHHLRDLEQVCDHLAVLSDGHLLLAGDTARLLADHRAGPTCGQGVGPAALTLESLVLHHLAAATGEVAA
jgi:ABC-2 type transport system ATP-binding protein